MAELCHAWICVDELDLKMKELAGQGVELIYPSSHDFYGGRWAAIRDPFGNCLELIELPKD